MNTFINSLVKKPRGSFVFVDDDEDELFLLTTAVKELGLQNDVHTFLNGREALEFLKETKKPVFMVLSDLNMPVMDGLEFKRMIEITPELKIKGIPFIFHSNTGSIAEIKAAYSQNIQGYLKKAPGIDETMLDLQKVISLWSACVHPNDLIY